MNAAFPVPPLPEPPRNVDLVDGAWEQQVDAVLLGVLGDARRGTLEAGWRASRAAAAVLARRTALANPLRLLCELVPPSPLVRAEGDILAMRELNELPLMDWEPLAAAVGKPALTAWYIAGETLNARGKKRGDFSNCEALWHSHQLVESYEAGLVASGDVIDWVAHSRERLNLFMICDQCEPLAAAHRTQLDDPAYRAGLETLPDYWRS